MNFARPHALYLLLIVPLAALLLAWSARRKRTALARLGTPDLVEALSHRPSPARRRWRTALWFLALTSLVIALARPRWGTQVNVTAQRGVQVMVTLDVSSSMLAEDVKPDRLARAKLTVKELMDRLGGNEIGLVLFSGAAFVQFPLTADLNTARSFLDAAGPRSISRPGTALEEAIRVALDGFPDDVAAHRVILLLTDGEGHEGDPLKAARDAAEAGVTIYAIGFGSPQGEPIPLRDAAGALLGYKKDAEGNTVLSRLDETTLTQIADATGGRYFRASPGGAEIEAVAEAIASMATGETESRFEVQGVERFQWFVALALAALVGESVMGVGRKA